MSQTIRYTIATVCTLLLALPCAAQQMDHSMPGMTNAPKAPAAPVDSAMMAGMAKMNQDMAAAPMTGNADKDFVAMMIPHHQGAIAMAETELRYGKDPALLALARAIVAAQNKEIGDMRAWQQTK